MIKTLEVYPAEWNDCGAEDVDELRVIGWANVYAQFIDLADYIYLTEIKKEYEGDAYFPAFEEQYEEVERETGEEMHFVKYKRSR